MCVCTCVPFSVRWKHQVWISQSLSAPLAFQMPWGGLLKTVLKCSAFRGYKKLVMFLSPLYTLLLLPGQWWTEMAVVQHRACPVALAASFLDGYIISLGAHTGVHDLELMMLGVGGKSSAYCCLCPRGQPVTPTNPVPTEEGANSQELLEYIWSKPWLYCAQLFYNQLHKKQKNFIPLRLQYVSRA